MSGHFYRLLRGQFFIHWLAREAIRIEVENVAENTKAAKCHQLYPAFSGLHVWYM
jgi:hypothetical protein